MIETSRNDDLVVSRLQNTNQGHESPTKLLSTEKTGDRNVRLTLEGMAIKHKIKFNESSEDDYRASPIT